MIWIDIKRIIRTGWTNFKRSVFVSIASVLVFTITLSVIISLIFLQKTLHNSLDQIKDKVDITVYFTTSASEPEILSYKNTLEKLKEVENVSYTSAGKALEDFRTRHKDDYLTIEALDELPDNPLGATLDIKAKDPTQYESISKYLNNNDILDTNGSSLIYKINYNQNKLIIDRLNSLINGAQKLGFLITLILVIISITITFNTIRLTIHMSKEEIGVMRLVGAANRYIRGPFMVEGVIYGVVASVLTMIIFLPITIWFGHHMSEFLGLNLYKYYISNIFQILIILLASGILLGAVSAFIATRKYLNK